MRNIEQFSELAEIAKLETVKFYELAARSASGFNPTREDVPGEDAVSVSPGPDASEARGDEKQDWHLYTHTADDSLGFRVRLDVETGGHSYLVDAAVLYSLGEPVKLSRKVVAEFIDKTAFATLYPFVRETIAELANKLVAELPSLPRERPAEIDRVLSGTKGSDRPHDGGTGSSRRARQE